MCRDDAVSAAMMPASLPLSLFFSPHYSAAPKTSTLYCYTVSSPIRSALPILPLSSQRLVSSALPCCCCRLEHWSLTEVKQAAFVIIKRGRGGGGWKVKIPRCEIPRIIYVTKRQTFLMVIGRFHMTPIYLGILLHAFNKSCLN